MHSPRALWSGLENRVFLGTAGLIAGITALGAIYGLTRNERGLREPQQLADSPPVAGIASPREAEDAEPPSVAFPADWRKRTVEFCAKEVRLDRSFVIFANGTCVLIHEPSVDPLTEACAILAEAGKPGAVFATATCCDCAVMVTYRERLFQRFAKEDVGPLLHALGNKHESLMTEPERVAGKGQVEPPDSIKLGFLGRWCLMKDAAEKKPLRIVRERRNHTASLR